MDRLLKSRNYLMKCLGFVLLLGFISLVAIGGCNNDNANAHGEAHEDVDFFVDGISGEIDKADFSLRVSPSGGLASKDTAKTLDGLLRNIRNISNAEDIFSKMGRSNVIGGVDCLEL